ncbi:MAG TPA: hypothetical protein VFW62_02830 [bacterium]|nr:hypothetical protein [bacterium]
MGNEAVAPSNFVVTAQPLCTSASQPAPAPEVSASEEGASAQGSSFFSPLTALFSSDPLQGLRKQTQLFSSAKDIFAPDGNEPIPVDTCSYVTISGSGSFGDVEVGRSETRSFSISNPCACPVTVYFAGVPSGFSAPPSSISLSANGSSSFSITFRPTSDTYYSGSISSNPAGSVSLSGRGVIRR